MPTVSYDLIAAFVYRLPATGPELLVLRRAPGAWMAGTWHMVYGKIEPGETAWQAALREMAEETGLRPVAFYQLEMVDTFYIARQDAVYHCPCFAAQVSADAVVQLDDEHDAFDWLTPDQAAKRYTWPGQRRAVAEIVELVLGAGPAAAALQIRLPDADR